MNRDLYHHCSQLVRRFVHTQYDGITGQAIKAGHFATDAGAKALRDSIDAARKLNARKRRALREVSFEIVNLQVPDVPEPGMQVTAVEAYALQYDSADPAQRQWHGRRGHTFTLVMSTDGSWAVDEFTSTVMEERPGPQHGSARDASAPATSRPAATGSRPAAAAAAPARSAAVDAADAVREQRDRARNNQLKWLRRWNAVRKYGLLLIVVGGGSAAYLWFYGSQQYHHRVCLYSGQERESLTLMDYQVFERDTPAALGDWASRQPGAGKHCWVARTGWDKALGEPRIPVALSAQAQTALATLALIHDHARDHQDAAAALLGEYRLLVDQLVPLLGKPADDPTWRALQPRFERLQQRARAK